MKKWEVEMWGVYRDFCKHHPYGLEELYVSLEKIAKQNLLNNTMNYGDSFTVYLGNGVALRFQYDKNTSIYAFNYKDKKKTEEELVLKATDNRQEERKQLSFYGDMLRQQQVGLGIHYPKEFQELLFELTPGQLVSFENGAAYVCMKNNKHELTLKEVFYGEINELNIESFMSSQTIKLNYLDETKVQNFYQKNQKMRTGNISGDYTFIKKIDNDLKFIYKNLQNNTTKQFQFGPIFLNVRKNILGFPTWYDNQGKKISEETVRYLFGFLNTKPVVTDFIRNEETEEKKGLDALFKFRMEKLSKNKDFEQMLNIIKLYVIKNKSDLKIDVKTFEKDEKGNFNSISYIFKEFEGRCDLLKVYYEDNDFNGDIKSVKKITEQEFLSFCEEKYNAEHFSILTKSFQKLRELNPTNNPQELKQQMIDAKKMTEQTEKDKPISIFDNNISISTNNIDFDDLLKSVENNSHILNMDLIYKEIEDERELYE